MAYDSLLSEIGSRIEEAISRESWVDARLGLRELVRILVDATISGDNDLIARVDEMLAQAFSDLSLDASFEPALTATALGWSTDGLRDVSQLARRRYPAMTSEQRAAVLRDAETRILALLVEGNGGPRSNREIAERLKLNVATVARTLTRLREAKKVKSWPEGRFMMNQLVPRAEINPSLPAENAGAMDAFRESTFSAVPEWKRNVEQNIPKESSSARTASKPSVSKKAGLFRPWSIEARIVEDIKPQDLAVPKNPVSDHALDAAAPKAEILRLLRSGSAVGKQVPPNPPPSARIYRETQPVAWSGSD
jgi:DNA-binding CsgD family transcriptional regulator